MDPTEGEVGEPSHVGRWRQQKGPDEPPAAVEEERIDKYKPQRDAMPTAIPRAGPLQGSFPGVRDSQKRTLPKEWKP